MIALQCGLEICFAFYVLYWTDLAYIKCEGGMGFKNLLVFWWVRKIWSVYALLLGLYISAIAIENSFMVPQKWNIISIWSSTSFPRGLSKLLTHATLTNFNSLIQKKIKRLEKELPWFGLCELSKISALLKTKGILEFEKGWVRVWIKDWVLNKCAFMPF